MKFLKDNDLILKFMIINVCTGTWVGLVNFIIPVYALSLHATSVEIGLIRGLSGVGDLLLVLPAGMMIDYFGAKRVYPISCILGALITITLSFAGAPWELIVIMIFYGMARSIRTTSMNASFFQHMNTIGVRKSGWYKGSMTVGSSFLGSVIGGVVISITSFAGYFVAASMFLLGPLIVTLGGNRKENPLLSDSAKNVSPDGGSEPPVSYRSLLKNKILIISALTECVNSAFFITFSTFITVMVIKDLGYAIAIAALLISIRGLANVFVVFFCGRLLDLNNNLLYFSSFSFSSVGLLLLGTSSEVYLLVLAAAMTGISAGIMSIITFTRVGGIDGDKGKVAGIFSFGQKLGSVSGPVLAGVVAELLGVHMIFLFFIPIFLSMALYNFWEWRRTGSEKKTSSA